MTNKCLNNVINDYFGNKKLKRIFINLTHNEFQNLMMLNFYTFKNTISIKRNISGYNVEFILYKKSYITHIEILVNNLLYYQDLFKYPFCAFTTFEIPINDKVYLIKFNVDKETVEIDTTYSLFEYLILFSKENSLLIPSIKRELVKLIYISNFTAEKLLNIGCIFIHFTILCGYDKEIHSFLKEKMKYFGYDENYFYSKQEVILSTIVNNTSLNSSKIKPIMKDFLNYKNTYGIK